MSNGEAAMDSMIARLRKLPQLVRVSAPPAAQAVDADIRANIDQGRAPDGTEWEKKADGGTPLKNAGRALSTRAVETVLVATLEGPEALHSQGRARGGIRREILPKILSASMIRSLRKVFIENFEKMVKR